MANFIFRAAVRMLSGCGRRFRTIRTQSGHSCIRSPHRAWMFGLACVLLRPPDTRRPRPDRRGGHMGRSMSIGNQLHRFDLAVSGAHAHASELPKETARYASNLESTVKEA